LQLSGPTEGAEEAAPARARAGAVARRTAARRRWLKTA
jgi:hypothetical protein